MIESYPLHWPDGWTRTPSDGRKRNYLFKESFAANRDELMNELRRLGAKDIILSTNIPLRRDGLPMANARQPQDPGIAVYFKYKKRQMCFACDKYLLTSENIRAIALTIGAIRGIERWGASDMMERAFRGFTALPSPDWRAVLGFAETDRPSREEVDAAFRKKARIYHPDAGNGDISKFHEITWAKQQAYAEMGI
jgi:hypothetical protein